MHYNLAATTLTIDDACLGKPQTNFMPSISAAIGDHSPQCYIWRIVICLMMTTRFQDGWVQFYHMSHVSSPEDFFVFHQQRRWQQHVGYGRCNDARQVLFVFV
jgi:hypothetical protein